MKDGVTGKAAYPQVVRTVLVGSIGAATSALVMGLGGLFLPDCAYNLFMVIGVVAGSVLAATIYQGLGQVSCLADILAGSVALSAGLGSIAVRAIACWIITSLAQGENYQNLSGCSSSFRRAAAFGDMSSIFIGFLGVWLG